MGYLCQLWGSKVSNGFTGFTGLNPVYCSNVLKHKREHLNNSKTLDSVLGLGEGSRTKVWLDKSSSDEKFKLLSVLTLWSHIKCIWQTISQSS